MDGIDTTRLGKIDQTQLDNKRDSCSDVPQSHIQVCNEPSLIPYTWTIETTNESNSYFELEKDVFSPQVP